MDRSWKSARFRRRWIATLGAAGAFGIGPLDDLLPVHALAQAPVPASYAPAAAGLMTWEETVLQTQKQGKPSVLIVTSKATRESTNLARLILSSPAVARLKGKVGVAELCAEQEPEQVNRLRVGGYPTFVAFRRGKGGDLEVAASYCGTLSADELSGWVRGLGLLAGSGAVESKPNASDAGLTRTGFWPEKPAPSPQYPSPQYAYPPPPMPPAPPVPPPPPYVPREVYVEPSPPVEREVIIEREVVVEPAPREVYVEAAPRPREVYIERAAPREVTPRNVLTRPAAPRDVTPRDVTPQPRQVIVREVAPQPAPRQVIVREVAPQPAPREVYVERAAPREVYVERAAAPRAITPRNTALIQPGPIARAVGSLGRSLAQVGLPRVEVETETTYQIAAPREASVVAQAAPPPVQAAPPPVYAPPPPPYAPSPQAYPTPYAPSPQGR